MKEDIVLECLYKGKMELKGMFEIFSNKTKTLGGGGIKMRKYYLFDCSCVFVKQVFPISQGIVTHSVNVWVYVFAKAIVANNRLERSSSRHAAAALNHEILRRLRSLASC